MDPKLGYGEVYDYDSYILALDPKSNVNPVMVGKLLPDPKNKKKKIFKGWIQPITHNHFTIIVLQSLIHNKH